MQTNPAFEGASLVAAVGDIEQHGFEMRWSGLVDGDVPAERESEERRTTARNADDDLPRFDVHVFGRAFALHALWPVSLLLLRPLAPAGASLAAGAQFARSCDLMGGARWWLVRAPFNLHAWAAAAAALGAALLCDAGTTLSGVARQSLSRSCLLNGVLYALTCLVFGAKYALMQPSQLRARCTPENADGAHGNDLEQKAAGSILSWLARPTPAAMMEDFATSAFAAELSVHADSFCFWRRAVSVERTPETRAAEEAFFGAHAEETEEAGGHASDGDEERVAGMTLLVRLGLAAVDDISGPFGFLLRPYPTSCAGHWLLRRFGLDALPAVSMATAVLGFGLITPYGWRAATAGATSVSDAEGRVLPAAIASNVLSILLSARLGAAFASW